MKRLAIAVIAILSILVFASSASANIGLCIPSTASADVKTPESGGACKVAGATKIELPGATELTTLDALLPHMSYIASGIGGKPTIRFTGVNVQVVNGEGATISKNGEGNLVIGYDENYSDRPQTGSHNLIVGEEQGFTSFGSIVGGRENYDGGVEHEGDGGAFSFVVGEGNVIDEPDYAAISGGQGNQIDPDSWHSSIGGGKNNEIDEDVEDATISGGAEGRARAAASAIEGGRGNATEALYSSIFGGKDLTTTTEYEAIP